jgi:hypothetical protein
MIGIPNLPVEEEEEENIDLLDIRQLREKCR